jgi:hypothetical protein
MAAGDPILINLSGATFNMSAETGCIIQSSGRQVESKMKEVFNAALGYTIGYVFYDFVANTDFRAIINGTTGLTVIAPGVVSTLANDLSVGTAKNGVATGGIYTRTVNITHEGEDLRMISGTAVQRHGIS